MAQVRFLDQVPVGVYNPNGTGGGGAVDVYYSGSLVLANVPFINFTGSTEVYTEIIGGIQGVTVLVSGSGGGSGNGFPFSGSAVITGSLIISGSAQPLIIQTLPYDPSPNYVVTYDTVTGVFSYSDITSGTNGTSGTSGTSEIGRAHV